MVKGRTTTSKTTIELTFQDEHLKVQYGEPLIKLHEKLRNGELRSLGHYYKMANEISAMECRFIFEPNVDDYQTKIKPFGKFAAILEARIELLLNILSGLERPEIVEIKPGETLRGTVARETVTVAEKEKRGSKMN
jgi:hypothetical protein